MTTPVPDELIHSVPLQLHTKALAVKRVANGWLVWLNGTPATPMNTYLYLHDDGVMQRVTEGPGRVDIQTWRDADDV